MPPNPDSKSQRPSSRKVKIRRARSFPHAGPIITAVTLNALFYLGLLGVAASTTSAIVADHRAEILILAGSILFTTLIGLLALLKRRSIRCPLCKGTPLIHSGALPHANARRWWPLNHASTAMLSIMISGRFHCMDCGSFFDLHKQRSQPNATDHH